MKKVWKVVGAVAVLTGFITYLNAANTCAPSDNLCFVSGPSQSPTTQARLDASGNLTLNGNINSGSAGTKFTQAGITIYSPQSVTAISSTTVITPTASYVLVTSTGGDVTCGATGGTIFFPCVSTATATSGQWLVIGSTQGTNAIVFSSTTVSGMDLGSATRKVANGARLTVQFDAASFQWKEVSFSAN